MKSKKSVDESMHATLTLSTLPYASVHGHDLLSFHPICQFHLRFDRRCLLALLYNFGTLLNASYIFSLSFCMLYLWIQLDSGWIGMEIVSIYPLGGSWWSFVGQITVPSQVTCRSGTCIAGLPSKYGKLQVHYLFRWR